uniref:Uncharacterized protein LOC111101243 isoform X2 n=1 Tax=Crassostrea virginica TaxID=6565 RepID=A0A8B8AD28_CRAVI|nr:uncharacterized protein LOC111101243 isoform X2 [Crassostrea virginica]
MSGNFMTGECLSGMKIKSLFVSFTLMLPVWFEKVQTSFKELSSLFGSNIICCATATCLIVFFILKVIFDLQCLVFSSTYVRQKVFKPFKTKRLAIICIILLNFSSSDCPIQLISHNNADGFYVRTCQSNGTDDVCVPCDANTYLLDPTNSSYPLPCVKAAECPPETVMASEFPPSGFGCNIRCRCDENRGFLGNDPCNCKRAPVIKNDNDSQGLGMLLKHMKFNTQDQTLNTVITVVFTLTMVIFLIGCVYTVTLSWTVSKIRRPRVTTASWI